jgi:hypothetical protein
LTPAAEVVQLVAAVFAVVFIGAAIGKADAFSSWTALVERFPVGPRLRRSITFALPIVEILVGVVVLVTPAAGLAVCSFVLASFATLLFVFMPELRGADCRCFGAVAPVPIDLKLVLRNVVLGVVAAGASAFSWMLPRLGHVPGLEFAVVALTAVLAVLVVTYKGLPTWDHVGELNPPETTS